MLCPRCTKEIKDGSKFCPYCGENLNQNLEIKQQETNFYQPEKINGPELHSTRAAGFKRILSIVILGFIGAIIVAGVFIVKGEEIKNIFKKDQTLVLSENKDKENSSSEVAKKLSTEETKNSSDKDDRNVSELEERQIPNLKEFYETNQYPLFLLENKTVDQRLKALLGRDFDYFIECFDTSEGIYNEERDSYIITGGVRGLYTIMEGIVEITQSGELYAAYLEDNNVNYYSSNKEFNFDNDTFLNWIFQFGDRPIVYKNQLDNTQIGGVYSRNDDARFDILYKEDTNSIYFEGSTYVGANFGDVSNSIMLDGTQGVYEQNGNYLYLNFMGDILLVYEEGEFGGLNVTFNGVYKKIADKSSITEKQDKSTDNMNPMNGTPVTLSINEWTDLNLFLSNFAEAYLNSFSEETTEGELINFAFIHNKINYASRVTGKTFNGNSYEAIEEKYIASTINRFFNKDIGDLKDMGAYQFANEYCYIPASDGGYYGYFAQATEIYDIGDNLLGVTFEIYESDYDYQGFEKLYEPKSIWGDGTRALAENTGEIRYAILEKTELNGKRTYYLKYME